MAIPMLQATRAALGERAEKCESRSLFAARCGLPRVAGSAVKGCARRTALRALHDWGAELQGEADPSDPDEAEEAEEEPWTVLQDFAGTVAFLPARPNRDPGIEIDVLTPHRADYHKDSKERAMKNWISNAFRQQPLSGPSGSGPRGDPHAQVSNAFRQQPLSGLPI